jgi:hypothetical protein
LKKPAKSSSVANSDSKPERANDGKVADTLQFAALLGEHDPFWRVDLLDFYLVTTVELVPRIDAYSGNNDLMEVRVGKLQLDRLCF